MYLRLNSKDWTHSESIHVIGHVFFKDRLYTQGALCALFKDLQYEEIKDRLKEFDGFFSAVIEQGNEQFVIVDHLRIYPIFYNTELGIITDQILYDDIITSGINEVVMKQYQTGFFTLGNTTIALGWNSVIGGTFAHFKKKSVRVSRYWQFQYNQNQITDEFEGIRLLEKAYNDLEHKILTFLNGRTVIIPLSGGHDSRFLLYLLVKNKYRNIITFTYGIKGNIESKISQELAKILGVKWFFVEYDPKKMHSLFISSFSEVAELQCNACSIPHLQDWYAIDYLTKNSIIPFRSVIMPGHTGDLLAGTHFHEIHKLGELVTYEELSCCVIQKHLSRTISSDNFEYQKKYLESVCNYLAPIDGMLKIPKKKAEELFERFDWEERQEKYICNSMRLYSYYGYDYFCPMNYKTQIETWCLIDNSLRFDRNILKKYESTIYKGELRNLGYANSSKKVNKYLKRLLKLLKGPMYSHYLFGYFNFGIIEYLKLLFTHRFVDINFFVQESYINELIKRQYDSNSRPDYI